MLHQWEWQAAERSMSHLLKRWQITHTLNQPQQVLFVGGASTLGAWVQVLANYARLHQHPWQFVITHHNPDLLDATRRHCQWYPDIQVIETDTTNPSNMDWWPDATLMLTHSPLNRSTQTLPTFVGQWPVPWWQKRQWSNLPEPLKAELLKQPLGKDWVLLHTGLYTHSSN
jgi:hypothetical protein